MIIQENGWIFDAKVRKVIKSLLYICALGVFLLASEGIVDFTSNTTLVPKAETLRCLQERLGRD